ncbi:Uncharacterised protein [Vibrio cholerae]|nr:Uncharacterised protein [Vibrio cholerae]
MQDLFWGVQLADIVNQSCQVKGFLHLHVQPDLFHPQLLLKKWGGWQIVTHRFNMMMLH